MRRAAFLVAVAMFFTRGADGQRFRYQAVSFAELLRAHVRSTFGMARLPQVRKGDKLDQPAVFVTATYERVYLHGEPLMTLEKGMANSADLRMCKGRVSCVPRLRDAIARARNRLAAEVEDPPPVVIVADAALPYPTLLLIAHSAAEAGAALSIRIAACTEAGDIVGLPVWAAPGRPLVIGRAQDPVLASVEINTSTMAVRANPRYLEQPTWAGNLRDVEDILGRVKQTPRSSRYSPPCR